MLRYLLIAVICTFCTSLYTFSQTDIIKEQSKEKLVFFIGSEVNNANDKNEKEIIHLWKDYLLSGKFQDQESPFWSFEKMRIPDEYLWALGVQNLQERDYQVQCKIIGIFPVSNGYYALKSAFTHIDEAGEIHLDLITSVYAKKIKGKFLLISSAEYLKTVLSHHKIGNINYYVHPFHKFNEKEAQKMNEFNLYLAKEFDIKPIEFDYFVANTSREIVNVWGYEYLNAMYQPDQTGGVASVQNKIIYSGNNSEYYPHELVHIYTSQVTPKDTHFWINEGIATFYGGSGGYSLDWHLNELKKFLEGNPNFDLSDIDKLNSYISNGKHNTDFRYVIGGLLMRKIHNKYGVLGFKEALNIDGGTVSEFHREGSNQKFFLFLENKLGIKKGKFDTYVKEEMKRFSANVK